MIYVFGDRKDDLLSLLFRAGYSASVSEEFVYAKGAETLLR